MSEVLLLGEAVFTRLYAMNAARNSVNPKTHGCRSQKRAQPVHSDTETIKLL
ncbi:MAG TPA: hypothetical protein VE986_05790 [Hyphomicrobiales bacterium]|nr:hypothetical protein [Hyphomicrobiales bacterium]